MPRSEVALAPLQEWMQSVVTHPGDVHDAAEAAAIDVGSVVLPSKTLQPIQRVVRPDRRQVADLAIDPVSGELHPSVAGCDLPFHLGDEAVGLHLDTESADVALGPGEMATGAGVASVARTGSLAQAAAFGEVVVLSTPWSGAREAVILVDTSYSMGYGDRWSKAQAAARDAVNKLSAGDRAHIQYLMTNFADAIRSGAFPGQEMHREHEGSPGYTAEGAAAGQAL